MLDLRNIAHFVYESLGEILYPRRCIFCDMPGPLICEECINMLPIINQKLACPRCGAPYGKLTCTECNMPNSLDSNGVLLPPAFPFEQATAACSYEGVAKQLITTYKDSGERALSTYIASLICSVAKIWKEKANAIVCVPPNLKHVRKRGFDHIEIIGEICSQWLELPLIHALKSTKSFDQRMLSPEDRFINKDKTIHIREELKEQLPENILLIDDVFTTGATLVAATNALLKGGACRVFVAVCARVW